MDEFRSMNRREALKALLIALTPSSVIAAKPAVSTPFGTGSPGYSDQEVNDSPVCQQTRTVGGAGPTPRIDCTRGASAARDQ